MEGGIRPSSGNGRNASTHACSLDCAQVVEQDPLEPEANRTIWAAKMPLWKVFTVEAPQNACHLMRDVSGSFGTLSILILVRALCCKGDLGLIETNGD